MAGVRSGRLPIVLDEFAALFRRQQDLRHRMLLAFSYPVVLLGVMAALMLLFHLLLTEQFAQIFRDFGIRLPDVTYFYLQFGGVIAWTMVGLTIAAVVLPLLAMILPLANWFGRAVLLIPVLGPIIRFNRYAQFSQLIALLLESNVPLPDALRLTSNALQGTAVHGQCRTAATAVEQGMPLDQALALARLPDSLTVLVAWGQQKNCLAESFRAAAETFEARTNSQNALLNMIVLPLIYLSIITFIGFTALAMMMPLIALIANLSSVGLPTHNPEAEGYWFVFLAYTFIFLSGIVLLMLTRWRTGPAPALANQSG